MAAVKATLGMRGDLTIRVIRANPTPYQQISDAIAAFLRRFGL